VSLKWTTTTKCCPSAPSPNTSEKCLTGRSSRTADTLSHFARSWHHTSCSWSGLLALSRVLEQQRLELPPLPWSIQLQSTVHLFGAAVLIPTSLTLPSTTPCELCLDACVAHQRTTFPSSQASNLLSFVAKEPHCLQHAVQWDLDSWTHAPLNTHASTGRECTAFQIETLICAHRTTTHQVVDNNIHAARWVDQQWNAECLDNTVCETPYFYPRHQHPHVMTLPRTSWIQLNRLRTGVGSFRSCLHKWDIVTDICIALNVWGKHKENMVIRAITLTGKQPRE